MEDPNVYSAYITKFWASAIQEMANQLLPYPPFYFLRLPIFMYTMFSMKGYRLKEKLTFLRGKYSHEQLIELCQEDYAGMPILHVPSLLGSNNTITFVYLLTKYLQETGCDISGLENILEFGGGYGSLARLFYRFAPRRTYVIVDLPLMSCIQWLYLSSVLGEERVHLVTHGGQKLETQKVNLVPVSFIKSLDLVPDMFISTWALDESAREAQLEVIKKGWLNAKYLLLAYGCRSWFDAVEDLIRRSSNVSIKSEPNLRSTIVAFR